MPHNEPESAAALPSLRPDAVILAPAHQTVRIAVSAQHVVTIRNAPPRVAEWLATLDGTKRHREILDAAPMPQRDAAYLLAELDSAGFLIDANWGLPFRDADSHDLDALRLAVEARDGALRTPAPQAEPARVWLTGATAWTRPLSAALAGAGVLPVAASSGADIMVEICAALDQAAGGSCPQAMALGLPHLAIEVSAVDAALSPLTIPGRTACRHCWSLHTDQRATDWRSWTYARRNPVPPRLPAHHRALVVALSVEHTLMALDVLAGRLSRDHGGWERYLDLRRATISLRTIEPHPSCGCVRLAA